MKTLMTILVLLSSVFLYLPTAHSEELSQVEVISEIPQSLSNPRQTMATFLTAMAAVSDGQRLQILNAVSTLDLSGINGLIRANKGRELAHTLFSVIGRSKAFDLNSINTKPASGKYVFGRYLQGEVEIVKQPDGKWLFSEKTLIILPAILEGLLEKKEVSDREPQGSLPFHIKIRAQLPDIFKGGFLLEYWQWIGLFIVVVLGSIADKVLAWFLARNIAVWQRKLPGGYTKVDNAVLRPLGLMAMAIIWWLGLHLFGLPDTALIILSIAVKLLVSLSAIWSAFRLVDVFNLLMLNKAKKTQNKFDDLLVPLISKSLKLFIIIIGFVFSADNLDVDVTSLLAGLGIGGLAFALAAKDLLGNLFGSLTVLLDRPFQIGDWVVIGDVEGSVEEVGFRSTRIRTFYNSLITLPNALLTTSKVDNMGARRYRRMKTMLGLTYDTPPEKIDAFCAGIRELIQLHPYMRKDYYQVYFNQYSAASLDILVYVFWQTPDWNTELRERHRFLLDILRLAKQLDVEFAYPTQTLYLKQDNAEAASSVMSAFQPTMTEADAMRMGQNEAASIVDATLGKGVKPSPVTFP